MLFERRAIDPDALREDLLHERRQCRVSSAQCGKIAKRVERALDLLGVTMLAGHGVRRPLQLLDHALRRGCLGPGIVEERTGKHDLEKAMVMQIVTVSNGA